MKKFREEYIEPKLDVYGELPMMSLLNSLSAGADVLEDFLEGPDLVDWGEDLIPYPGA